MRLLYLLHAHPDLQAGGTELFARDLFRALRGRGHDGLFVAGTARHQRSPNPGTPFQAAGDRDDELLVWTAGFDPFFLSQIDLHGVMRSLADLLQQQRPDIVHVHHVMTIGVEVIGLIRRVLPRCRIVMTLHDYYPVCANDGQMVTTAGALCSDPTLDSCHRCFPDRSLTDHRLRRLHLEHALAQVDHFVAPSQFLHDRYVAAGLSPDRISVVRNGLPSVRPTPTRAAERRDHFAFFGHINRFKGATVALAASTILSQQGVPHRLALYGGTDHQSEQTIATFKAACDRAPDAHYFGRYRRESLPGLIGDADWVIFPSEWWENAPLVINEAFQHWRPVICSDIGGAAEAVAHGRSGLHFTVGSAAALAQTMRRAIEEPGLWQNLVDGIAPPASIEQSAAQHEALYASLLAAHAPADAA